MARIPRLIMPANHRDGAGIVNHRRRSAARRLSEETEQRKQDDQAKRDAQQPQDYRHDVFSFRD
jgi:hypothetical protein